MLFETSITGLTPVVKRNQKIEKITKKKKSKNQANKLDFQISIQPAKFVPKPYATFFNPYRYGCSVLCNHPFHGSGRTQHYPIKRNGKTGVDKEKSFSEKLSHQIESMLGRASRETARAPTRGASSISQASRRKTPAPRPHLIVDLNANTNPSGARTASAISSSTLSVTPSRGTSAEAGPNLMPLSAADQISLPTLISSDGENHPSVSRDEYGDEEVPRRRGKKVKKKKKPLGGGDTSGMGIMEPGLTQVSTCNADDVPSGGEEGTNAGPTTSAPVAVTVANNVPSESSTFDVPTLSHILRNTTPLDLHSEYNETWARVLHEAVLCAGDIPTSSEEPLLDGIPNTDPEKWIHLPRTFSLMSARFELPLDRNSFNGMTSLEYLRKHVKVSKNKKLLYNHVYCKYCNQELLRKGPALEKEDVLKALSEVMGKPVTEEDGRLLEEYVDFDEMSQFDLLTWYGLCAFSERILGADSRGGSRSVVELTDFLLLERMLEHTKPNEKLVHLLNFIDEIGKLDSSETDSHGL